MDKIIVKEKKYNGRYVALKDFDDFTIVSDGKNPKEAFEKAVKKGIPEPAILYIPNRGMI